MRPRSSFSRYTARAEVARCLVLADLVLDGPQALVHRRQGGPQLNQVGRPGWKGDRGFQRREFGQHIRQRPGGVQALALDLQDSAFIQQFAPAEGHAGISHASPPAPRGSR